MSSAVGLTPRVTPGLPADVPEDDRFCDNSDTVQPVIGLPPVRKLTDTKEAGGLEARKEGLIPGQPVLIPLSERGRSVILGWLIITEQP